MKSIRLQPVIGWTTFTIDMSMSLRPQNKNTHCDACINGVYGVTVCIPVNLQEH